MVARGKFHLGVDLGDRFLHGAAQVAAADAVFNRDVALVGLAINLLGAFFCFDVGQLGQRDPFTGRSQQANVFDRLLGIPVRLLVPNHQVVACFALQHLADRASSHCGLNRILYVRHIDAEACCSLPVNHVIQVGLAKDAENAEVLDSPNFAHNGLDLVALLLQQLQIIPVKLDRKFAFDAADRLLHVVGDWLGKVPRHPRHLLQLVIHGADQLVFVLVEGAPPFIFGKQINKIFGVEKTCGIGAVVGPSHLADHVGNLGKSGQNDASLVHQSNTGGRAGAGSQRAANPDCSFTKMGQELRPDHSAQTQETRQHQRTQQRRQVT